jgi:hypothetical protein
MTASPRLSRRHRLHQLRHPVHFSIDHAIYAEDPCEAGERHVEGLCVLEGVYLRSLPSCDVMPISEVRVRLQAGELFWWHGERFSGVAWLRPCACGRGVLVTEPPEGEHLFPNTQRVLERLATNIARFRAQEEKLSAQLAAGETSPRVREAQVMWREARESDERLQIWIPTEPELSNGLVMVAQSVWWAEQRAEQPGRQRRVRRWTLLALTLVGVVGWALGRTSARTGKRR